MARTMLKSLACVGLIAVAMPALAQDVRETDRRIDRLESEMRAVQRKVFPGGDKRYFEPEFQPTQQAPQQPAGIPATSPIADLTTRVDSLERQLRTLTGQVEQANFKVRQMEDAMSKFRADTEFRLTQIENGGQPPAAAAAPDAASAVETPFPAPATPAATSPAAKPATAAPKPDAAALAPAESPAKPADPIEAAYQAAYLSYSNQQYAKAETALSDFVAKHPKSSRASHAQYWLGRTYMAQKLPAQAAKAFLDNYRNMPKGARAPDSLYWLGQALMAMSPPQPAKACEVYAELQSAYGEKLSSGLKDQVTRARTTAKCGA